MRHAICLLLLLCGCGVDPTGEFIRIDGTGDAGGGGPTISFAFDIQPIFTTDCIRCHGGAGGLSLDSYAKVLEGGISGAVVIPGNPDDSILVHRLDGTQPPTMPADGPPLTAPEIDRIRQWILEGALNN